MMTPEQENELFQTLGRIEEGVKNYSEKLDTHIEYADGKFKSIFKSQRFHDMKYWVGLGAFLVIQFIVIAWFRGSISFGG